MNPIEKKGCLNILLLNPSHCKTSDEEPEKKIITTKLIKCINYCGEIFGSPPGVKFFTLLVSTNYKNQNQVKRKINRVELEKIKLY